MTETEEALIAGMRANPYSLTHMAAMADYWHETDDPRWEPLTWLVQHGKVGADVGYYNEAYRTQCARVTPYNSVPAAWWWSWRDGRRKGIWPDAWTPVGCRLILCDMWVVADEAARVCYTTSESP